MVVKNYYKILDLETSKVSLAEIKAAYRNAAKKYHPDVNTQDRISEERIKDINEAYRVLSVPATKRKYDRLWNSEFGKGQKAFTGNEEKGAIVSIFLGNLQKEKKNKETNKNPKRGENIETEIDASIYEAFFGLEKQVTVRTLDGNPKTFTFKIPKGIRNGEKIRIIGQGKEGSDGGKNGDMFIKINIKNDKKYKLKGYDIYTDLPLTPWEAALGTRANVETLDQETRVYIPQGIQTGEKIKIPGKGYIIKGDTRGDLIAQIKVVVPKKLTEQEREMYVKLKEISEFNPRK